jgi:hypothetical protein
MYRGKTMMSVGQVKLCEIGFNVCISDGRIYKYIY